MTLQRHLNRDSYTVSAAECYQHEYTGDKRVSPFLPSSFAPEGVEVAIRIVGKHVWPHKKVGTFIFLVHD